jgi:hypothetical protein
MTYQKMSDKPKKMVDKERVSGGKEVKRNQMPIKDPLTSGKDDAIKERTRKKTMQSEDMHYKSKMRKDKNQ